MKVYFLSSTPCALTLNGVFFGITDKFERFAEIALQDNLYAQFSPQNALPIGCFLSEQLRFSPPNGFDVYLLPDAIALYAHEFPPSDFTLKTIAQKRKDNTLITLFQQGKTQISIESEHGFFLLPLEDSFCTAEIDFFGDLIALKTEKTLALFTRFGTQVFCENVLSYSTNNDTMHVVMPLFDGLGRVAECTYLLRADGCERTSFTLKQAVSSTGERDGEIIAEELLPFAFFESVLLGLNYTEFLSEELREKADFLREFLGDFISVVPTKNVNVCGLVFRKGERLFEVRNFSVTVENGKITDLQG